jgi:hypothetical protein
MKKKGCEIVVLIEEKSGFYNAENEIMKLNNLL